MDNAHTIANKTFEDGAADAHARAVELYRRGRRDQLADFIEKKLGCRHHRLRAFGGT